MSGLDVASGIAGLISLTLEVSGAIARYAIAVKEYSKNVKELRDELDLLTEVLSRLSDFIQSEKARGRTFEKDSVLVHALSDCKRRIERIGDKLKASGSGKIGRAIDKLKWPFEQKDILQIIDNLRRYVHTFEFAITIRNSEFLSQSWDEANKNLQDLQKKVDQACETNKLLGEPIDKLLQRSQQLQKVIDILPTLTQSSEDLKEVSQVVKLAEQREQERRKAEILDWLAPLSTLHKHIELQNRRAVGTCGWLLESEVFLEWANSEDIQYDMLCHGSPGAGKTILCSMVIDHLRTKYKNDDVAVVHYYFDLAEQQAQTEYTLTRTILRQLCQNFQAIPTTVIEFYQRTRNELQDSLWLQELQEILQRIVATFSQCFVVVDAFDEADARRRAALLQVLDTVRTSGGCVKFFATSRPHIVIEQFEHALKLEVRADENDLRSYLSQKIDTHPHSADIVNHELKEELLDKLCMHADGVFLLPALQIDQILDQAVSAGDIQRSLKSLSTDLKQVFQSTIIRIESFSGGKRNLAFKALMWLSHARRPLRISELQHAIAVRFDGPEVDSRDISSISVILDSCCGLVELDGESACVKFVHGSISEYLASEDHGFFKDAELEIVRVCLKYLTMERLRTIPFGNRNDFYRAMEVYPLLDYASSYWGFHARGIDVHQYSDLAMALLSSSYHLLVTARVKDVKTPQFRKWKDKMMAWSVSGGAGIATAASFGLADLTRFVISQAQNLVLNSRNVYGSTPLHVCAIFGYKDTAEVLIAHGADLMDTNTGKATPFYLAVSYGQLEMCKSLLRYGRSQLDVVCKDGNVPLHKAADLGSKAIVEFLLQSGSLVNARNQKEMTALHLAARKGHTDVVQLLVLGGAGIEATNHGRMTPLDLAALGGHHEVVEYLIRQGANVNHKSREAWTPLHRAAWCGHARIVKLLLESGARLSEQDRQRSIPLQLAIKSGSLETVQQILHYDESQIKIQLKHRDWKKDRALDIAFYTAHYRIFEYLRDMDNEILGNDPAIKADPMLPLSQAIEQGNLQKVQDLLRAHPEWFEAKDNYNQTALHTAFRTAQWSIAEYLLSVGVSINLRGHHGWTPIHIAASLGDLRMVELALQWNADIFAVSDSLQTPLHKAAGGRSVPVIVELLRCGCLPSALNDKAMTPVHVAARQNFLQGVLVMISAEYGGRELLLAHDKFGRTPREWAERAGHLELSYVLRDEERLFKQPLVDINPIDSTTNRALSGSNSSQQLSRQSTKDSLTRRSTSTSSSLLLPTLERSASGFESVQGLDEGSSGGVQKAQGGSSGQPSPLRTPGTPNPERNTSTPMLAQGLGSGISEIEQRYAEMQLDFESD